MLITIFRQASASTEVSADWLLCFAVSRLFEIDLDEKHVKIFCMPYILHLNDCLQTRMLILYENKIKNIHIHTALHQCFFAQATFVHVQKVPKIFLHRKNFFVPAKKVFFGM